MRQIYSNIICCECGVSCERTASTQKFCTACRIKVERLRSARGRIKYADYYRDYYKKRWVKNREKILSRNLEWKKKNRERYLATQARATRKKQMLIQFAQQIMQQTGVEI
jgi:NMD protein affecting ribosome stability and mRNA decay